MPRLYFMRRGIFEDNKVVSIIKLDTIRLLHKQDSNGGMYYELQN